MACGARDGGEEERGGEEGGEGNHGCTCTCDVEKFAELLNERRTSRLGVMVCGEY